MAFQMVRSFFGQRSPSRSRVHEPIIESESFGNQEGIAPYDTRDVGKSANSNWFELARHDKEASESGRKPHSNFKISDVSGKWTELDGVYCLDFGPKYGGDICVSS